MASLKNGKGLFLSVSLSSPQARGGRKNKTQVSHWLKSVVKHGYNC